MKVYSELWHIQNTFETSMTERFAKSSYLMHFSVATLKIFRYKNFLYFFLKETHSEKISYIFSKERFSYISGNRTLPPPTPKKKNPYISGNGTFCSNIKTFQEKETPKKISYISGKGNHKKPYIAGNGTFSVYPKKMSCLLGKGNPKRTFYIFLKETCSYILETETPTKFSIFQEMELPSISGN